jgi:hypothetical protein
MTERSADVCLLNQIVVLAMVGTSQLMSVTQDAAFSSPGS